MSSSEHSYPPFGYKPNSQELSHLKYPIYLQEFVVQGDILVKQKKQIEEDRERVSLAERKRET